RSSAQKVPTISVSRIRNAIMYSRTRIVTDFQLAMMQNGIKAVVRITKGSEMPSTPMWYVIPVASHDAFSTNWKSGLDGSKRQTRISDTTKVMSVVHSAIQRELRHAASSSPRLI